MQIRFTDSEWAVVQAVNRGTENGEICDMLGLRPEALAGHLRNISEKVGLAARICSSEFGIDPE